ncbi:MAG: DNA gyrase subunit A [Halanaerobium sp.]|nr:DNA gyrase subunit A [Halanaerobium sp.]
MADDFDTLNLKPSIVPVDIEEEMKEAYIDYAMSVIVSRALPDIRDGLKPVQRRILYALQELGMTPNRPHRKSARIVGEVLGKYHPHGDAAVYDTMVRMAQDFSYRYPLVDGHGNFGSVDGDTAAAMRYTEARMSPLATDLLRDLDQDTVDFVPNFDESLQEPEVLPARVPNLLINGSSGIAVGMATSIPPHNINEVIEALIRLIDDPNLGIEEIMKSIQGPDFPTGGIIMGRSRIYRAYKSGRGRIKVRAKARIEEKSNGRSRIIVDELPYQVNKARLVEQIAGLVREEKLTGITDLRDESDRSGMRIVIDLKKGVVPKVVLNRLYKHTRMQTTFSIIMIALVDGEPRVLSLKQVLIEYLKHQREVVTRRTEYQLRKAKDRAHILEGLLIALDDIDAVIKLIRQAPDVDVARSGLMERFELSEDQANAILRMRLQRLTNLETEKVRAEYQDVKEQIAYYQSVLGNKEILMGIIKDELLEVKERYSDERRTEIVNQDTDLEIEDLIPEEDIVVTLTHHGYIKRMPIDTYRSQHRGGKGITGISTKDEDFVENIFTASSHHYFLFFTNHGYVYRLKAYQIPEASRQARGTNIINLLEIKSEERITAVIPIREFDSDRNLIMATKNGLIKKTPLIEYESRFTGLIGLTLREGDELITVKYTDGNQEVILGTAHGKSIRFHEKQVRSMGRTAQGVKSIELDEGDQVIGMGVAQEGNDLLVVSEQGYGKRTPLTEYRPQIRGGKGLLTMKLTGKNGLIAGLRVVSEEDEIMLISREGILIRIKVGEIPRVGRNTQGVRLMKLDKGDYLVSLAFIDGTEEEEKEGEKEDEDRIEDINESPQQENLEQDTGQDMNQDMARDEAQGEGIEKLLERAMEDEDDHDGEEE